MLLVALCYFATSDSNNNLPEALMEDASAHRFADQGPPGADTARVQQKVIADYWNWKISPEEQMQKALDKFEKILRDLVEVKVKLECVSNCVSEAGNNATSSGGVVVTIEVGATGGRKNMTGVNQTQTAACLAACGINGTEAETQSFIAGAHPPEVPRVHAMRGIAFPRSCRSRG